MSDSGVAFGVRPIFRGLRAAATLLTRLPVGGFPYTDIEWRWAAAHLPAVGMVLGGLYSLVWFATLRAGSLVSASLAVAAALVATGAIHEDGLADTADALGGGRTREEVRGILKDSRIGAFGGAALAIVLFLRVALIARLDGSAPFALVLAGAASRLVPVWLMVRLPYVTDASVAKSGAVVTAGKAQGILATAWVALLACGLEVGRAFTWLELALVGVVIIAVGIASARLYWTRVGGITGDLLGAAQQMAECGVLLGLALVRGGNA